MKKIKAFLIVFCITALAGGCTSTFTLTKGGERGYVFGSKDEGLYKMLCESGDLAKILADTPLKGEIKDALYRANCAADRSKEKVKEIYTSLTVGQRKDLRLAFKRHGYEVNYMIC